MTDFQKDIKNPKKMGALMDIEYSWSINQTETDCQYWVDNLLTLHLYVDIIDNI